MSYESMLITVRVFKYQLCGEVEVLEYFRNVVFQLLFRYVFCILATFVRARLDRLSSNIIKKSFIRLFLQAEER